MPDGRHASAANGAGSVAGAVLCAMLGVAAGALVRSQVVAVVGALVLMFVATPLLLERVGWATCVRSSDGLAAPPLQVPRRLHRLAGTPRQLEA